MRRELIFRKNILTEEYLRNPGLNERQIKALMYVKEKGEITNKEYQGLNAVSNKTAYLELSDIVEKGVLILEGRGRQVKYLLKVMKK
jgi:ATP-dependent DNA helicase RecG